ncbi:MAG: division/cell wall cluster transcriptional repressor MraZ, partial [Planctomycetes bacterium]|nr:division/cell wall cluster transcriptional repressor MraZ [Planctomycetota bacterium]
PKLNGRSVHSLDSKGRLIMPTRVRMQTGEIPERLGFWLTRGSDNCICVYTPKAWDEIGERLRDDQQPFSTDTERAFRRLFFSDATYCACDPQGRMTIPAELKSYAKIDKEVVLVGAGSYAEIWDTKLWEQYYERESPRYGQLLNELRNGAKTQPQGTRPTEGGQTTTS